MSRVKGDESSASPRRLVFGGQYRGARSSISSVCRVVTWPLSKMQKGFFRQREKLRFVRVSEYVYRKFSGSTSARTHREPHHVDFKPSLICASSRTNFPLSLYPASLCLLFPPFPSSLCLYTRVPLYIRAFIRVYLGGPRFFCLSYRLPDFFLHLRLFLLFLILFSFLFLLFFSFLLLLSPSRCSVRWCARLPRDLHRRMCWDNLVVIVLSLFPSSLLPPSLFPPLAATRSFSSCPCWMEFHWDTAKPWTKYFSNSGPFCVHVSLE